MATTYTTTFGIDVTKKCYGNYGGRKNWLYGSLSDDCLKNISLTYEEHFGQPYAEQVRDEYEKLTSSAVNTLKKFVKVCQGLANGESIGNSISESGSGGGGKKDNLTGVVMDLGVAVAAAQEAMGSNGVDQLSTLITKSVTVPAYNIPTRSSVPGLSLGYGNSIKINFRYGNAGIFNAKTEVYDPIKNIMKSFQNFSESGGEVTVTSSDIPWDVGGYTAKADALTKFLNGKKLEDITSNVKDVAKSTMKFSTAAGKIISKKAALEEFYSKLEENPMDYVDTKQENLEKIDDDGWHPFGIGQPYKVKESVLASMMQSEVDVDDILENGASSAQSETKLNAYLSTWNKTTHTRKVSALKDSVDGNKKSANNVADGIWENLANLATIEVNDVCDILKTRGAAIPQLSLSLGCYDTKGNNIYYNLDDINTAIDNGTITNSLKLSGVPEKVEAGLDYTDLDANGYPKSGWIAIKKLWVVRPYDSFTSTFSR